jgi:hypothetical protein
MDLVGRSAINFMDSNIPILRVDEDLA